jgi:DNA-binding MarR family transcriptional regulator
MTEDQLRENLNWLLLRVSILVKQGVVKISEEYNLTLVQTLTLCLLDPNSPVPMNSMSGLLGCDPSNVTGIVDRLVASHYVERKESPTDRRVKTIQLTEAGEDLRNTMLNRITQYQSQNLERLTHDESDTLKTLLQKVLPKNVSSKV